MQQTSVQKQILLKEVQGGNLMITAIKQRIKDEKGLSLVELLAVIVILGIVAAIAVPSIGNIIENSRYNAAKADAMNVLSAANLYFVANPEDAGPVTVSNLKTGGYLDNAGKVPDNASIAKDTGGNKITTQDGSHIDYSGGKLLILNGATISGINGNSDKGSDPGNKTINN